MFEFRLGPRRTSSIFLWEEHIHYYVDWVDGEAHVVTYAYGRGHVESCRVF